MTLQLQHFFFDILARHVFNVDGAVQFSFQLVAQCLRVKAVRLKVTDPGDIVSTFPRQADRNVHRGALPRGGAHTGDIDHGVLLKSVFQFFLHLVAIHLLRPLLIFLLATGRLPQCCQQAIIHLDWPVSFAKVLLLYVAEDNSSCLIPGVQVIFLLAHGLPNCLKIMRRLPHGRHFGRRQACSCRCCGSRRRRRGRSQLGCELLFQANQDFVFSVHFRHVDDSLLLRYINGFRFSHGV
mmetsp:Transcript_55835/g.130374  ORF Transcript_55835/g.130374 Transcript_55835/m.130374 type:complete len:238 (+) Transcript_55835:106-819(+)